MPAVDDRTGLCSVTFRSLPPAQVIQATAAAGLHLLEWGADVHATPGDPEALRRLRDRTRDAGLAVSSYGSYWRAGHDGLGDFTTIAEAAAALGAPRIRVWAGTEGSADTSPGARSRVVGALREAADIAAGHGMGVATEFHGGTLTDTAASTARLLEEAAHPALSTYWQPPVGEGDAQALAGLRTVLDHLSAIHVFSWWPDRQRLPLTGRERLWRQVLSLAPPVDLLLEFVPGDDPGRLAGEARTLRSWLTGNDRTPAE
jgi:3-dehydroshikimate dehydratase